jgi:hypothetical protein
LLVKMQKCAVLFWLFGGIIFKNRATAQTPLNERVLVVYNSSGNESLSVAKYYMAERHIPKDNWCKIAVSSADYIKQDELESRVKRPLRKCIDAISKQQDTVHCLLLSDPLRSNGTRSQLCPRFVRS